MKNVMLNNQEYEIKENKKECFDIEEVENLCTDYFIEFDYILGDYAYNKLRLKGFYENNNKKATKINNIDYIDEYIKLYCAYECKYFILKKLKSENKV